MTRRTRPNLIAARRAARARARNRPQLLALASLFAGAAVVSGVGAYGSIIFPGEAAITSPSEFASAVAMLALMTVVSVGGFLSCVWSAR